MNKFTVSWSNIKDIVEIIGTFASVYIAYNVYKLQSKESNPKVTIKHGLDERDIMNIEGELFFKLMEKELFENTKIGGGFPCFRYNNEKMSYLEIENKGDFPATNLKLVLYVDLKKGVWETGIDEADIKNPHMETYSSKKINYCIKYLPPGETMRIDLFIDRGQFIGYDIRVKTLKSRECKFIKKDSVIKTIKNELFNMLSDSNDERNLYGCGELRDISNHRDEVRYI